MENKNRNIFWQALVLAILVFGIGIFLGFILEKNRVDKVYDNFKESELYLLEVQSYLELTNVLSLDCTILNEKNQDLANKIYDQALIVDRYEASSTLSKERLIFEHKRIDLLRTLLWINTLKIKQSCNNTFNMAVYIYDYPTEDLVIKAKQSSFSKALIQLKNDNSNLTLISVAGNLDITAVEVLLKRYNINQSTAIILNDKVIYDLSELEHLNDYIK